MASMVVLIFHFTHPDLDRPGRYGAPASSSASLASLSVSGRSHRSSPAAASTSKTIMCAGQRAASADRVRPATSRRCNAAKLVVPSLVVPSAPQATSSPSSVVPGGNTPRATRRRSGK
jgi:hypothetical protein